MAYYTTPSCMHMMAPLQARLLVTLVLLLAPLAAMAGSSAKDEEAPPVYRFELIHVDAGANNSGGAEHNNKDDDTYLDTARYDSRREYLMELRMGTPAKTFKGVADTGSDVIWTRRTELQCVRDGDGDGASSTFAGMACRAAPGSNDKQYYCDKCDTGGQYCAFSKTYGSKKMSAEGYMAGDVVTLSRRAGLPDKEVPISFGCARRCRDDKGDADCHRLIPKSADGVVGLNRGPMSLPKQLGVTKFSYCLNDPLKPEQSSPLWFGGGADLELRSDNADVQVQTTPLVKLAKAKQPTTSVWFYKYYVELQGISVGKKSAAVKLPSKKGPEFKQKSLGGDKAAMVLDSGCSYTHLEAAAFDPLTELLAKKLTAQVFLEPSASSPDTDKKQDSKTCFRRPRWFRRRLSWPRRRPDVVLHLRGGAKMHLRWSTYMTQHGSKSSEFFCLNIVNSSRSILGNIHQQNMHMLYDLRAEKLSFLPVPDCSKREL